MDLNITPAAIALVLAVALFVANPGRQGIGTLPGSLDPGVTSQATPVDSARQIAGALIPGGSAALLAPPVLEEAGSPGARVYRLDMGGGSDPTSIFLVIDESIDI